MEILATVLIYQIIKFLIFLMWIIILLGSSIVLEIIQYFSINCFLYYKIFQFHGLFLPLLGQCMSIYNKLSEKYQFHEHEKLFASEIELHRYNSYKYRFNISLEWGRIWKSLNIFLHPLPIRNFIGSNRKFDFHFLKLSLYSTSSITKSISYFFI